MVLPHVPHISAEQRPLQVRFFQEPDVAALEAAINAWLQQAPRREIVDVRQSVLPAAGGTRELIVSVWYIDP
ncbi:MAG: hypothetical protein L0271_26630 [Gemmatimonadetes bacterium]|nr:hypothetical protein [Gemmatimonadota bacterium]